MSVTSVIGTMRASEPMLRVAGTFGTTKLHGSAGTISSALDDLLRFRVTAPHGDAVAWLIEPETRAAVQLLDDPLRGGRLTTLLGGYFEGIADARVAAGRTPTAAQGDEFSLSMARSHHQHELANFVSRADSKEGVRWLGTPPQQVDMGPTSDALAGAIDNHVMIGPSLSENILKELQRAPGSVPTKASTDAAIALSHEAEHLINAGRIQKHAHPNVDLDAFEEAAAEVANRLDGTIARTAKGIGFPIDLDNRLGVDAPGGAYDELTDSLLRLFHAGGMRPDTIPGRTRILELVRAPDRSDSAAAIVDGFAAGRGVALDTETHRKLVSLIAASSLRARSVDVLLAKLDGAARTGKIPTSALEAIS